MFQLYCMLAVLVAIILLPFVGINCLEQIIQLWQTDTGKIYLGLFVLSFFLFSRVYASSDPKSSLRKINTFEHEATHALVAMLFFRKVTEFVVSREGGGHVMHETRNRQWFFPSLMITLAPYFLPTIPLLLLPIYLVLDQSFKPAYLMVFVVISGLQFGSNWSETGMHQTDITKFSTPVSYIVILALSIFYLGWLFSFLNGGFMGMKDFLYNIYISFSELPQYFR